MKTACSGGSSIVFKSALNAAFDSMCTSSRDQDPEAVPLRRIAQDFNQLAGVLDAVVGRRVELDRIERLAPLGDLATGGAPPHGGRRSLPRS